MCFPPFLIDGDSAGVRGGGTPAEAFPGFPRLAAYLFCELLQHWCFSVLHLPYRNIYCNIETELLEGRDRVCLVHPCVLSL